MGGALKTLKKWFRSAYLRSHENNMSGETMNPQSDVPNYADYTKYRTREEVTADERNIIKQWRERRLNKTSSIYSELALYSCSLVTLKSFLQNINFMVVFQMFVSTLAVFLCQTFDISLDIPVALYVSPIVFPLAFAINTDFQRREKVLEDLALFKSSGMVWYFCMREWKEAANLDYEWIKSVHDIIKSLLFHLCEYLITSDHDHRMVILRAIYEDFSSVNVLVEKLRGSDLPQNTAIISRSVHLLHSMSLAFERLRVVREYRSPRAIRSFNKVFIMLLPIILAPYFVYQRKTWMAYYLAIPVAFVFSALQAVQDKLDDPFDGMGEDDINLDTVDTWVFGTIEQTVSKTYSLGRFNVSINPKNTLVDPNEQVNYDTFPKTNFLSKLRFFDTNNQNSKTKNDEVVKMKRLDTKVVSMVTKLQEENRQIAEMSFNQTHESYPLKNHVHEESLKKTSIVSKSSEKRFMRTEEGLMGKKSKVSIVSRELKREDTINNTDIESIHDEEEFIEIENDYEKHRKIEKHNSSPCDFSNRLIVPTNEFTCNFELTSPRFGRSDSCITSSLRDDGDNSIIGRDRYLHYSYNNIPGRYKDEYISHSDGTRINKEHIINDLGKKAGSDFFININDDAKHSIVRPNSDIPTIGITNIHENSFDSDDLNHTDSSCLLKEKRELNCKSGSRTSLEQTPTTIENVVVHSKNGSVQSSLQNDEKLSNLIFPNKLYIPLSGTDKTDDNHNTLKKTKNGFLNFLGKSNATRDFVNSNYVPPV